MAKLLKLRRGTTTQHGSFTGAEGELTIDTTKDTAVVHDGSQAGGRPLLREDLSNLPAGTIDNADVNASAAIAGTKISPNFGSQNITTTGTIGSNDITITNTTPSIDLVDSDNDSDFKIQNANGLFLVYDTTNSASRLSIASDGTLDVNGNLDANQGVDVTGNITVTGTVDGRDVAADGTKLDGIESGATADQTGAEILSLINSSNILTTGSFGRDANDFIQWTDNDRLDVYINGSNEFRFEADGDFHADGDVIAQSTTTASDRRLKENIEVIPNALDKVQALNGVSFDWKKTGEKSAGVIAQEVQGVLPEAVKEVTPVGGGDSHLTVNYHALTSILIESIKELKAEIEELKGGK
jgi:hypothetical protein